MKSIFDKKLLSTYTIKNQLGIALGLIGVAFLVFLGYLLPGASSWFENKTLFYVVISIVLFILVLGFLIICHIVEPMVKISQEARFVAEGDLNREIRLFREDEIGQLGAALNRMIHRMKANVEELKNFSQTTETINAEINRRVLTLSNLLEVSNLIAQNAQLKEIVEIGLGKCLSSGIMTFTGLILKDEKTNEYHVFYVSGQKSEELLAQGIRDLKITLGSGVLGKAILKQKPVIIDSQTAMSPEIKEFRKQLAIPNAVLVPVSAQGNMYGLLIAGNDEKNFLCSNAEREFLQLIAKQIAIAHGNAFLRKEFERSDTRDRLTGLFNRAYIDRHLVEEIKRAASFQKPCSLVLIAIDHLEDYRTAFGHLAAEDVLMRLGFLLKETLSGLDQAARFGDHAFVLILPEKNKRCSIEIAEGLRRKIEEFFSPEKDLRKRLTSSFAVTENPVDGASAPELIQKAQELLKTALQQGGNRVCHKA